MIEDLSDLVFGCQNELHRLGLTWKSVRVLDYCEKVTGYRDAHYLDSSHLQSLLTKLQQEKPRVVAGVKVKTRGCIGVVQQWDAELECWLVQVDGVIGLFEEKDLEVAG